jgi:hypothetical protein
MTVLIIIFVYSILCFLGFKIINAALGSYFWFTGYDPYRNFRWSSDIYWIPLFFIITLGGATILSWRLGVISDRKDLYRWLKIFSILALVRLLFALTTWDYWLLWPWLYGNPYEIWVPDILNSWIGFTMIEAFLFFIALLIYLSRSSDKAVICEDSA